ncbi:MAG: glycosyltransferase family 2 protein [Gemmatimonadetes bacterium]|nr:glycosyltransferase family 2 protein [Gemmatimonadota bacterium]MYD59914.1 glycosyltransferase family 2 protein [Gemmatimonadota bacterium]MYK50688.1 glycosyltransferase family 2 protein [Gemmatimonadota bacterium]
MPAPPRISVIIPVFNEQDAIEKVIGDIPSHLPTEIIVVDNGSTDQTAKLAAAMGARIVRENRRGYGSACLAGIAATNNPDIVVFLDGDYSDHPNEMPDLIAPILENRADLVIGSRVLGNSEPGALMIQARFGNRLATSLIKILFGVSYTDLGPFRAIRYRALRDLNMRDKTFGWTVEMQVKAAKQALKIQEMPVSYRKRIGVSKITGTLKGTLKAGWKILFTIFKYWFTK